MPDSHLMHDIEHSRVSMNSVVSYVMQGLILAGIVYVLSTLTSVQVSVATVSAQVAAIQEHSKQTDVFIEQLKRDLWSLNSATRASKQGPLK